MNSLLSCHISVIGCDRNKFLKAEHLYILISIHVYCIFGLCVFDYVSNVLIIIKRKTIHIIFSENFAISSDHNNNSNNNDSISLQYQSESCF